MEGPLKIVKEELEIIHSKSKFYVCFVLRAFRSVAHIER